MSNIEYLTPDARLVARLEMVAQLDELAGLLGMLNEPYKLVAMLPGHWYLVARLLDSASASILVALSIIDPETPWSDASAVDSA